MTKYINAEDVAWPEKFTSPLKSAGAVGSDYSPPPIAVQEMCNKTIDKCRQAVENATGIRKLTVEGVMNQLMKFRDCKDFKPNHVFHKGIFPSSGVEKMDAQYQQLKKIAQAIVKLQEVQDGH